MIDYSSAVSRQYGKANLVERISAALADAGKDLDAITQDDLALFDQLHPGGRGATRTLAELAGIGPGTHVLDIGAGVGGPARTLASEFGCHVVGIDLSDDFVEAANSLTARVGLANEVTFRKGNALDLPFHDRAFDAVWSQNAIMNINDKEVFLSEAWRVLRPEGILVLELILKGPSGGLDYPVFWANTPEISFLTTPDEFRQLASQAGFAEVEWQDITARVVRTGRRQREAPAQDRPALGLEIVYDNVPVKGQNTMRGFEEGQIIDIYAVFRRKP